MDLPLKYFTSDTLDFFKRIHIYICICFSNSRFPLFSIHDSFVCETSFPLRKMKYIAHRYNELV